MFVFDAWIASQPPSDSTPTIRSQPSDRSTGVPPATAPRRTHVVVINADIRVARDLCKRLASHELEARAFDDLRRLRRHIEKHGATLDVVICDPIVPGGEPSAIVAALQYARAPAAVLLTARYEDTHLVEIAAQVRAEEILLGDPPTEVLLPAIARAKEVADRRRSPWLSTSRPLSTDDVWQAVLDLMIETFEREGLRKFRHRYAIRMRVIGMTDEEAAKQRGIAEPGYRRDVGEAHAALGAEDAYALINLLAVKVSAAIERAATQRGISVSTVFAELREALLACGDTTKAVAVEHDQVTPPA